MKKLLFIVILAASLAAYASPAQPESAKIVANWVTYDHSTAPAWLAECPSYRLQLTSDGVAHLDLQIDCEIVETTEGTWYIDGRRVIFEDLAITDAYSGRKVTFKSAKLKEGEDGPYIVAKTSAGRFIFIILF